MMVFDAYQQKMGASFLMPDRSVKESEGILEWVGTIQARCGSEAIDRARSLPAFVGWLPSRLEAFPVVELNGMLQ